MAPSNKFWDKFEALVERSLVPRFSGDPVRPCTPEDFQQYTAGLENNLRLVADALDEAPQNQDQWTTRTKRKFVKVFAVIGEQHRESPWNTPAAVDLAGQFVEKLCRIYKRTNLAEILTEDDVFLSVLLFLRPRLLKDTWKFYPGAVTCYKWLLESVEKPTLKRHVSDVLPTALIILDDYVPENQAFGLECISVVIEHCQKSNSLRNLNYDEVIYNALETMLYKVKPNLIVPLYTCIYNLLEYIEFCDDSKNDFGWTKHDNVILILLDNMELESKIECRFAYAVSLKKFLTRSSVGRWTERITRILSEYCENASDLKTTNVSLDLVKMFLSVYQPRSSNFYSAMNLSLLKLSLELASLKNVKEIKEKTYECITMLNKLCPKLSQEITSNSEVDSVLKQLQNE